jgi:hypothetical protein
LDQDFGAVGDHQNAGRAPEGLADSEHIECGKPGFSKAGGDSDESAAIGVRADSIEGVQGSTLPWARRMEDCGKIDGLWRDKFSARFLGVLGIASDERIIERSGLLPEIGESAG